MDAVLPTVTESSAYWYDVALYGAKIGETHSHPRCLPRSWTVYLIAPDGTRREAERISFKTRKESVRFLAGETVRTYIGDKIVRDDHAPRGYKTLVYS